MNGVNASMDMYLKSVTLKSREIIAIAIGLLQKHCSKLSREEKFSIAKTKSAVDSTFVEFKRRDRSNSPQRIESERERYSKLRQIAFKRLEMIQSCLNVILSALFSSDILDDKVSLFFGPS